MRIALPLTTCTPLLRSEVSSDADWQALLQAIALPSPDGFRANVSPINDPRFAGLAPEAIDIGAWNMAQPSNVWFILAA